jgi:HPt (histidine-containing phosphotransfer) domain-containing protein
MSDEQQSNRQQFDAIGDRYLQRTRSEMALFCEALAKLESGDLTAFTGLQQLAHKVYGSGAMFGFDRIGDLAQEVETLALAGKADTLDQIGRQIQALAAEIDDVCTVRGV